LAVLSHAVRMGFVAEVTRIARVSSGRPAAAESARPFSEQRCG